MTAEAPLAPRLTDAEAAARFEELQAHLVPQWRLIGSMNDEEQCLVVVPSMSMDLNVPGSVLQAYEERFLFLLLLLRKPRARIIYVTSQPILASVLDYYLGLLPGVIPSHARPRLFTVAALDGSSRPLSLKLLERPRLLARIRALIPDPERAHLVPYNTTTLERELAVRLGIPMYGADPRYFPLGTKSGGRRLFAEEGVPHPLGIQDVRTLEDVTAALARLRSERPSMRQVLVKLNEGVSGEGNALVDLSDLPPSAGPAVLAGRVRSMRPEAPSATFESFMETLGERAGVVEERIVGTEFRSPSVQMRVTPLGEVEMLSTHDQLLGGSGGQSYLGCTFPADTAYAPLITREARKIGERLMREGVLGRFAVDFVVVRSPGEGWRAYAIEINLRKGGTTHPFLTLEFLTDGSYDAQRAVFQAPSGRGKCYVATDHLESPLYRALSPDDLFDIAIRRGLHFNQARQTGVVFHMMAALSEEGRVGLTAVGDTHEEARELYARVMAVLDHESRIALREG